MRAPKDNTAAGEFILDDLEFYPEVKSLVTDKDIASMVFLDIDDRLVETVDLTTYATKDMINGLLQVHGLQPTTPRLHMDL